ncbi:MAG: large protein possible or adhesin AidA-related protein [Bacteroidetes bacterium]|jgi:gliding motility-associated-like protein|nr:large protein possible or adhesin AidA-related protein [Bacteroidota bacterium]
MVLVFFAMNYCFSQNPSQVPFNASFWNAYADKLQLSPKDREEFISSHKKLHSQSPAAIQQFTQQPQSSAKGAGSNNGIFAGPCVNADFELGSTAGWTTSCGFHPGFNPLGCCPNAGGQQTIMAAGPNDPFGGFPVVFPGGNFSLRLGNSVTGGQADRIEQTFMVSPANANFSYKYAVVFQDPNHPANEQPSFQVEMLDAFGAQVPCTFYYIAAGAGIPGFLNSPTAGVIYKPWSTVMVDLTPYIGQNITIRFSTYDCSLGGHFGYAYIDGVCQSFTGGGLDTVCVGGTTNFCAPAGVASYTWNGPGVTNFVGQCVTASAAGIYTVSTTLFSGCQGPAFTYTLANQTPPVANAGTNATVCANNNTVSLSGSITGYSANPVWSSSGTGTLGSTTNLATTYTPSTADIAAGSVTLSLSTINNDYCPADVDDMVISITPSPVVNAGTGGSTCSNSSFALNGSVTAGASTGSWTTNGNGSFSPSANILNPSYTPGSADIAAGSVTLTLTSTANGNCFPDSDTLIILIKQPATSNAGPTQTLCSTTPTIGLTGIIGGGSTTGIWSASGAGAFNPGATALTTTYNITAANIAAGQVTFTLSSTNNGPCPVITSTVMMSIIKPATVTAGPNQFLCSTAGTITLVGSVTSNSNTGIWNTAGLGTFNPNNTTLNAGYAMTASDITTGTVVFTLTSTNNGPCAAVSDTVMMKIRQPATSNSGPNQTLCSNVTSINLTGVIGGGGTTGIWSSSGAGGFTPLNTSLNTSYAVTAGDITSGSVIFTLTSTNNGPCAAVSDTTQMVIIKIATVSAGPNQFVCSSAGVINLAGTINSPSNTVAWSSSGAGGFTPGNNIINPAYSITAADILGGTVVFTVTSTNNGPCPAVSDTVMMKIKELATVNSGPNQSLCSNATSINLTGVIGGGGTTVAWGGSGPGAFAPSNTSLNTSYGITATDVTAGSVIFTLTSTNNGPCPAVSDTTKMVLINIATVTAGPNQFLCSNGGVINLGGTINSPSNTVLWSGSGAGGYTPGNNVVNPTYSLTAADIIGGTVTFTITSTNNGPCPAVSDSVMMKIKELASVNVGPNQSLCSTAPSINLNGTLGGGGTTGMWISSGIGGFIPSNTSLNTSYNITSGDVATGSVIFTLTSTNNGPCPAVSDTSMMVLVNIATITAGPNQYICSNGGVVNLSGTINSPSNTVTWNSNGAGGFSPSNVSINPTYSLTAADIVAGTVAFTVTSTNNGPCPATNDSVMIAIKELAQVNAGPNQSICSNNSVINLNGSMGGGATTITWASSGTGGFLPNNTNLNTFYGATGTDINLGTVIFTISSTNNGPCPSVEDSMMVSITKIATVTAGPNQYICSNAGIINLTGGIISPSNTVTWGTNGTGNFAPTNTVTNASYSISASDIGAGTVIFTITSTNNGVCPTQSDTVQMKIKTLATVNAGVSQNICSNTSSVNLGGTVTGGTSTGLWTSTGAGVMVPGATALNNVYFVSVADVNAGSITFTLSSTNNEVCPAVTDSMMVYITPLAQVNAGNNQYVCSLTGTLGLNGTVFSNSNAGAWSSSGGGTYSPSNSVLNPVYNITSSDASNGSVTFTLTSNNNGPCPIVRDTVLIKIKKPAVVSAGPDLAICSTTANIGMSGNITVGSTTGFWTSTGTGIFSPNTSALNANYAASAGDINAGTVYLILTSTNNEVCPAMIDTSKLTIIKKPSLNLLSDTAICSYQNPVSINASLIGGSGQFMWSSSGTGVITYVSGSTSVNYAMSAADIAAGLIKLTITSVNNGPCGDINASINVKINPSPKADFIASSYIANVSNDPISFTNQSTGANSYYWNFGDGGFTNLTNPIHSYASAGFYTVSLIAINQFDCKDTAYKDIKVVSDIQFPNVFTPNANGGGGGTYNPLSLDNDVFFPYTSGVTEYHLRIFNRWGELIFESKDITLGWDGYFNGKICQQDAYVWKADIKFFDGRTFNKTGSITLLR